MLGQVMTFATSGFNLSTWLKLMELPISPTKTTPKHKYNDFQHIHPVKALLLK